MKTMWRSGAGMNGRGDEVLVSHTIVEVDAGRGRAVKWRDVDEDFRSAWSSGSVVWTCAIIWRSSGVACTL